MSLRDTEQNLCCSECMKIALPEKDFHDTHYNLVHKFIQIPQEMKIPDAKAAVHKEWKKARDNSSMGFGKESRAKREVILEAQRDKKKVHFASLMDIFHLKNAELEPNLTEI